MQVEMGVQSACRECGLLAESGQLMQIDAVKAAYRRYARIYDTVFGPVLQPGRKAVLDALNLKPGERVLEVGVGTGLSLQLYPRDVRITGIDVSREMLDKARVRVARRKLENVEGLLEMDAERMDFPDASFDKVVAMYVVSVVERPAKLLEELHRVCKPDGEIFIVNHFHSDNRILGGIEKALSGFSSTLGFHPDFNLREMLPAGHNGEVKMSRVNLFWKILRLRNGVGHQKVQPPQ
jgi:phosphatidylethanolamine/phosphatidyl-N-methylethanolamine N-methyltransferase